MKANRVLKTIASLTLVFAMVAGIVLPNVPASAATEPKSIKISSSSKEVTVSKTLKLKATLSPKKAKSKITWSTSNKSIATVKNGTVTGKKAGTVTITAKTANGKTANISLTVKSATQNVKKGTVLWDQSKEKEASKRVVVRKYDDYKYNVSAIWLCPYNLYYDGRDKKVGEAVNNLGRKLRFQGEFKMDGPDAKELLVQLNYTQPKAYPIVWQTKENQPVKSGKWYKVNFTFTIPKNAVNGDTDDNGYNWPILLYFANKPNNTMIYKKGNDFTFRKFKITVEKP